MNITELLKTPDFRGPLTRLLFSKAEDPNIGCLLSATEFSGVISSVADPSIEAVILGKIVDAVIAADRGDDLILAIKNNEGSLMSYGFKLGYVVDGEGFNEAGETVPFKAPAMFGSPLPEGIRLQVGSEKAGSGEYEYLRPVAQLLYDVKNAKGKTITATLETGIQDTSKSLKIEYKEWTERSINFDEDELIEQGLMAEWATPKLGSNLGSRFNLVDLGELADQFGPTTYKVLSVTRVEKLKKSGEGFNQMVEFELAQVLDDGSIAEPINSWPEMIFSVEKDRFKGGIGFGDIVEDALQYGASYYLHVLGSKGEVRYDKFVKKYLPFVNPEYGQRMVIDGYLSSQAAIPAQLLRGAAPAVQALPQAQSVGSVVDSPVVQPAMKSAEPTSSEANFDDIPF